MNSIEQQLSNLEKRYITPNNLGALAFAIGSLWYIRSSVLEQKIIVAPATLLATLVLCVILYTRMRTKHRWQAAWESYAAWDLARGSFGTAEEDEGFSLAGID